MKTWLEKKECTGCEACINACPYNALSMTLDEISGFYFPEINQNKCKDCGLCVKSCPSFHDNTLFIREKRKDFSPIAYSAFSRNEKIRFMSTSGGLFTELGTIAIENDYIVFGASYDENNIVCHMGIDKKEQIAKLRQSKYVQSRINNSFKIIKDLLRQGKKVLFVGAPCQVAGLYQFLGKDYELLVTIEFICLGVNSPMAYMRWLEDLEKKYSSKINRVWFKYKRDGWRKSPFCTRIDFCNGQNIVLNKNDNYFMKGYLQGNLFLRESCSYCQYKDRVRVSDIILGDYWGLSSDVDDDKGTSIVIVNSTKGKKLFDKTKDKVQCDMVNYNSICKGNPRFYTSVNYNEESESFFEDLKTMGFNQVVKKHLKEKNLFNLFLDKIKSFQKNN